MRPALIRIIALSVLGLAIYFAPMSESEISDSSSTQPTPADSQLMNDTSSVSSAIAFTSGPPDTHDAPAPNIKVADFPSYAAYAQAVSEANRRSITPISLQSVESVTTATSRKACAVLTIPLVTTDSASLSRFVRFEPESTGIHASAEGGKICVTGAALKEPHRVTLMPGAPLSSGSKLRSSIQFIAHADDLPPHLAFDGAHHILARNSASGLELTVTNIGEVDIEIVRVPERAALKVLEDIYAGNTALREYKVESILKTAGSPVWKGSLTGSKTPNDPTSLIVPIQRVLERQSSGLFLVFAAAPDDASAVLPSTVFDSDEDIGWRDFAAAQWVVLTNVGVSASLDRDGMMVSVRRLDNAEPIPQAQVTLVTKNNDLVFESLTGPDGTVQLPSAAVRGQRADAPSHLVVQSGADISYLRLDGASLDLSGHPVDGRTPKSGVDAYVFTDRGIYRPGETIHVAGILRDAYGSRIPVPDSSIRLLRPDGIVVREDLLTRDDLDGFAYEFVLPPSSARGLWTIDILSQESTDELFGSTSVDVQDFVPERLALDLKAQDPAQLISEPTKLEGTAMFLYGAPASDLLATIDETLSPITKQAASQAGWTDYVFGDALNPLSASTRQVLEGRTTNTGEISGLISSRSIVFPTIGSNKTAFQPVRSAIHAEVLEPGGRPTTGFTTQMLLPERFIGMRAVEEMDIGDAFDVPIMYFNGSFEPVTGAELNWDVREISSQWLYDQNSKRWEVQDRLSNDPVASGTLEHLSNHVNGYSIPIRSLDWGRYVITIHAPDSGSYSRQVVSVGWSSKPRGDRPDFMPVMSKSSSFKPGRPVEIFVDAPFAGVVSMSIWTDSLVHHKSYRLTKGKNRLQVATQSDWFPGAYVTLQAFRPLSDADDRATLSADRYIPVRIFGAIYLKAEHDRYLDVTLEHPPIKESRQNLPIEIEIKNLRNEKAYVIVQAVDLGILNVTDFETPDPMAYFESKPALQTRFYDDYNKLIRADGQITEIRSGAGASAAIGSPSLGVAPTKSIALYSGVVKVGNNGRATVNIDIPDFNGTLRTTAVVWSEKSFGSATEDMVLSDPIVAEAILPRYLAPGDSSEITLLLANTSDAAITANVVLHSGGGLLISKDTISSSLNPGERESIQIPVSAKIEGQASFGLRLEGSDGFTVERKWDLAIRYPGNGPTLVTPKETLPPGGTLDLRPFLDTLAASSIEAGYVTVDSATGLPLANAIKTLLTYKWTCTEQTTSTARPILQAFSTDPEFVTKVSKTILKGQTPKNWIQENIDRILERQGSDGSVGLWQKGDGLVDPLLSARITGFLADAYLNGFNIRSDAVHRTANWSLNLILDWRGNQDQQQYALSVLMKNMAPMNKANLRLTRSYADSIDDASTTTKLNFAVALNVLGDSQRASELLTDAATTPKNTMSANVYYWRQSIEILDQAEDYFALDMADRANELLRSASEQIEKDGYLSVTTASAITKTMVARARVGGKMSLTFGGDTHFSKLGGLLLPLSPESIRSTSPLELTSDTREEIEVSIVLETIPSPGEALTANSSGLSIQQRMFDESGRPLANPMLNSSVNSRFIVVSEVVAEKDLGQSQILFQNPVPAGFQVDKIITPSLRNEAYGWLPEITYVDVIEARDDGVVAAQLDRITKGDVVMRIAYIFRATTPGEYLSVQSVAQDMYDASIFGITDGQPVTVRAAQ